MYKNQYFQKGLYIAISIFMLAIGIKNGNIVLIVIAAHFFFSALTKNVYQKTVVSVLVFFIVGCFLLYKSFVLDTNIGKDLVFGSLFLLLSTIMGVVLWLLPKNKSSISDANKEEELQLQKLHKSTLNILLPRARTVILDHSTKISVIGQMSGDIYSSHMMDYICILYDDNKVIPFRLMLPFIISYKNNIPIISICATHIGHNLLEIKSCRDFSAYYNKDAFLNKDYHGYDFSSYEEYVDAFDKISTATKKLFLENSETNAPIAYCIDVCTRDYSQWSTPEDTREFVKLHQKNQLPYYASRYRAIIYLARGIEQAFINTKITNRIKQNIHKITNYRWAKKTIALRDSDKNPSMSDVMIAKAILTMKKTTKDSRLNANNWFKDNGKNITSGESLLQYLCLLKQHPKGVANSPIIKKLIFKKSKAIYELINMKKELEEQAQEEARAMVL